MPPATRSRAPRVGGAAPKSVRQRDARELRHAKSAALRAARAFVVQISQASTPADIEQAATAMARASTRLASAAAWAAETTPAK